MTDSARSPDGSQQSTRPFRSPRQEAAIGLLSTADAVRHYFAALLEPYGVTPQQYNVLRILRGASSSLPTMDIVDRMIERAPGITRLLDRLHEKGLVSRERCPDDRRQVLCTISSTGLALLEELDGPVNEADEAVLAMLSDREVGRLVELLDRIREGQS